MNAPSISTDREVRSPRWELAAILASTLNLAACGTVIEAPEGNITNSPSNSQGAENNKVCSPPDKLSGESIPRPSKDVKARILAMKEYVRNSKVTLPDFKYKKSKWKLMGQMSKRKVAERIVKYCHLNKNGEFTGNYSRDQIEEILSQNIVNEEILMANISFQGFHTSCPLIEVTCDLSTKDEEYQCKEGESQEECDKNSRKNIGGLHIEYSGESFILVESLVNTGIHELIHLLNERWDIDDEEDREKKFAAELLLSANALELSGFEPCHGINYTISDQGGADAAQIALTNFENAFTEIISGATAENRMSDYQLKFYIFKHLLFEELGNEVELKKRIDEAIINEELTYEDLVTIGQFAFVISQEMMEEIKNQL